MCLLKFLVNIIRCGVCVAYGFFRDFNVSWYLSGFIDLHYANA